MNTDESAVNKKKMATAFISAILKSAKEHEISSGQMVNCFGYLTRLIVETDMKRRTDGQSEATTMGNYLDAFMSGLGAQCEVSIDPGDERACARPGAPLQ